MPKEWKASVICFGLFRFRRGPRPSSGRTPSGSGKWASSATAASSRRSRTAISRSFHRATSSFIPASSISAMDATAPNSISETRTSFSPSSSSRRRSRSGKSTAASRAVLDLGLRELPRPVLLAGRLVQLGVRVPLGHHLQGVGSFVVPTRQELRSEHGVEDGGESDAVFDFQESVVEFRVMQDLYGSVFEYLLERCEVSGLEHVYNKGLVRGGELEQANPPVAGRETRGLEVHADRFDGFEGLRYINEIGGVRDQLVAREALFHV